MSDGKCRIHPRLSSFRVMALELSEPRPSAIDAQCRSDAYSALEFRIEHGVWGGASGTSAGGFYVGGK